MEQLQRDPSQYREASCPFIYPEESEESPRAHSRIHPSDAILRVLLLLAGAPEDGGYRIQAAVMAWLVDRNQPVHDFLRDEKLAEEKFLEILRVIAKHKDILSIRAVCLLRLMNREGRRLEDIGAQYGVTRAFINKEYRALQNRLGNIRARSDKSEAARAQFREICLKRGARKLTPDGMSWKPLKSL